MLVGFPVPFEARLLAHIPVLVSHASIPSSLNPPSCNLHASTPPRIQKLRVTLTLLAISLIAPCISSSRTGPTRLRLRRRSRATQSLNPTPGPAEGGKGRFLCILLTAQSAPRPEAQQAAYFCGPKHSIRPACTSPRRARDDARHRLHSALSNAQIPCQASGVQRGVWTRPCDKRPVPWVPLIKSVLVEKH